MKNEKNANLHKLLTLAAITSREKKQEKKLTRAVKLHSSLTTQTKLSNFTNFSIKNIWNSCLKGYAL